MNSTKTHIRKGALTPKQLMAIKHVDITIADEFKPMVGNAEHTGSWCYKARSSSGKTTHIAQLIKAFARYQKVGFNSREEGMNKSMKTAFTRVGMDEVNSNVTVVKEDFATWSQRLGKKQSPKIWVVDSLQRFDMRKSDYEALMLKHPDTLFIFVTLVDAKGQPKGAVAQHVWEQSDVKCSIEGFRAEYDSRNDGEGLIYIIYQEGYNRYWANQILEKE